MAGFYNTRHLNTVRGTNSSQEQEKNWDMAARAAFAVYRLRDTWIKYPLSERTQFACWNPIQAADDVIISRYGDFLTFTGMQAIWGFLKPFVSALGFSKLEIVWGDKLIHGPTITVLTNSWVYLHCLGEVMYSDGVFTYNFPAFVLCECETWSSSLRQEHTLGVSET